MNLKFKNYEELEDIFGDDTTVCDEVTEYSDSSYLCDAISEVASNNVPVYNQELCEKCWELNEYVAEAKAQGLLEGADDLFKMLEMGAYEYYTQLLYNNLDTIALNIAIEFINEEYTMSSPSGLLFSCPHGGGETAWQTASKASP